MFQRHPTAERPISLVGLRHGSRPRGTFSVRAFAFAVAGAAASLAVACQPAGQPGAPPATGAAPPAGSSSVPHGLSDGPHDVVINGVRLWYRVAGKQVTGVAPVVFLHGGPGQGSYHFAALAGPYVEPSLRLVYFDQRGSGRSERPWTGDYAMSTLVEDIEGLRQELGVGQMALIGHSFGGTLALEYAAKYPAHVSAVVFVAGLWDGPLQMRYRCERSRALYRDAAAVHDSARGGAAVEDNCDWFWKLPQAQRGAINKALMFPDSTVPLRLDSVEKASGLRYGGELDAAHFMSLLQYHFTALQRLTMPLLGIGGRQDGVVVSDGLRQLTRLLPNARFQEYEQSGHFAYLDEPKRFARDVTAFLTSQRNVPAKR
jgi:proline iminopeptidase